MQTARIAVLLAIAACEAHNEPGTEGMGEPAALMSGNTPRHMANCPSAVVGSRTVAKPTSDGVDVVITADVASARAEIERRTELHRGMGEPLVFLPPHTGTHAGPGTVGLCPIIHNNTDVDFTATARGVVVHVVPRDRTEVEQLQRATEARVRSLMLPSS